MDWIQLCYKKILSLLSLVLYKSKYTKTQFFRLELKEGKYCPICFFNAAVYVVSKDESPQKAKDYFELVSKRVLKVGNDPTKHCSTCGADLRILWSISLFKILSTSSWFCSWSLVQLFCCSETVKWDAKPQQISKVALTLLILKSKVWNTSKLRLYMFRACLS